ncbi:orotidine-5'-phosphate decarboxylase [Clostridium aminobutyricum]|uniref:Orotidine 5'-phosphate decarboxylase n=1 Tax=Clostridium aminobutyricum TaxID=33953 RepID=A0A939D6Y3_CLOAM|nr:orotidine-5'-phosphate decarboxylase [Clostridium aminobutyricum]MBN7771968.1 orotidine-5'-phosphate decarboxylase [Clostridium aminobutyricum]
MIDALLKKIEEMNNPTVVGLDPTLDMIPSGLKAEMMEQYGKTPRAVAEMFLTFNKCIMDSVYDIVPSVKPQIAMYEKYGLEGIRAYLETIEYAKEKGLIVIGDIKRGDISSTAAAYAAHIEGTQIEEEYFDLWKEDWVTLNPYLGIDGIQSFIDACNKKDRGIFVLVKTSNPSSSQLQDILVGDKTIYETVAELVEEWGSQSMGTMGYSRVGAVVGATHKEQGEQLRKRMPHTFFLVPGYGAQGATGADLRGFFDKEGKGCIVNSSRGIIAAYKKNEKFGEDIGAAAREAALEMKADLQY